MKLHDLRPADGSRTPRTRVGRGIAAGKGKTAGRGTKGQKARAGGSIPPWFEGGQTPLHMRIPKLRGFKNRFKIEYEVVNIGRIGEAAALGAFDAGDAPVAGKTSKAAPATVNQEILRAVGLVRRLDRPLKVLGNGDLEVALFVVADAFSKSAVTKIEGAGGTVQVLEIPSRPLAAIGVGPADAPVRPAKGRSKPVEPEVELEPDAEPKAEAESVDAAQAEPADEVAPVADAPGERAQASAAKSAARPAAKGARPATRAAAKPTADAAAEPAAVKSSAKAAARPADKAPAPRAAKAKPARPAKAPTTDDTPAGEDA
ncbi:MAG: large subunit ribosomal protein [Chloroflexota bacterium]|nr:large subunit ribosomal protein [Chloroflexota bacterium]